jgi:hypothetical protein
MGSVAEYPEEETCQACTEPAEGSIKYLGDRLCNRCAAVLWAAQALVDNDYTDGPEIIPTVVFAALSAEERLFEELREKLAALEWTSTEAGNLLGGFMNIFAPYAVWALADGVLIIRPQPIALRLLYKGGKREFKLSITVGMRREDGSIEVRITYRFGPPSPSPAESGAEAVVPGIKNGSRS